MPSAVVILGAGASADFGVPTLRNVFKDVMAQQYLRSDKELLPKLEQVFWKPRGHTLQTSNESLTVEEMLTILRDWESEEGLEARPSKDEFQDFRRRLYVLIYKAVFEGKSSKGQYLNPLIAIMRKKLERVTWASFNWDCIFEASYWYSSGNPGPYGGRHNPTLAITLTGWRTGNTHQEYLKLHGSINWWMVNSNLTYFQFGPWGTLTQKWEEYAQNRTTDYPVILEPSAYKYHDQTYKHLEPQWKRFFERLCQADCVLIVGYSLPDADFQARSKILTAFQANTSSKWLVVDPSAEVCSRYHRLLGQQRVTIIEKTLTGLNNNLAADLQSAFDNVDFSEPPVVPAATATPAQTPNT